jgi:c-di-GMP-binding flagellar brake protein YcgR
MLNKTKPEPTPLKRKLVAVPEVMIRTLRQLFTGLYWASAENPILGDWHNVCSTQVITIQTEVFMGFFQRLLGNTEPHLLLQAEEQQEQIKTGIQLKDLNSCLPLMQLQESRQLLEVKWGSSSRVYQSLILAVDIQRGLIWIDELFPQAYTLDIGDCLTLRHHRKGEELILETYVIAIGNQFGTQGIALSIPEQIQWQPRRRHTRFAFNGVATLVKIRPLGSEATFGKLQDISTGGFSVTVSGNLLAQLRHGALLPVCEMTLDDQLHIRCKGRICAFRMQREPFRSTRICVQFVDLPEKNRIELMNCLNRLENHSLELQVA